MNHFADVAELRRVSRRLREAATELSPTEIEQTEVILRDALSAITLEKWARSKELFDQIINPK